MEGSGIGGGTRRQQRIVGGRDAVRQHQLIIGDVAAPPVSSGVARSSTSVPTSTWRRFAGHATVAYTGYLEGVATISEAIALPAVLAAVEAALEETSAALSAKHGLDADELAAYRAKILNRFRNPHLVDEVTRVGREPLRKLGRNDRFIGPASDYAQYVGGVPEGILFAVSAALRFDAADDTQAIELQQLLDEASAEAIVTEVMGVEPGEALFEELVEVVRGVQA